MKQQRLFDDDPPKDEGRRYEVPRGARQGRCSSCGAAIWWITTPTGASMPLSQVSVTTIDGRHMALPHWIDCPTRDQHRRKP